MPKTLSIDGASAATTRTEIMLALAPHIGISLDDMNDVRIRLAQHEAMLDAAVSSSRRAELEQLMAIDVAELAAAYRVLAAALGRGGEG